MVTDEALEHAFERIEGFARVQQERPLEEKLEAIDTLLEIFSMDQNKKELFKEWMLGFLGHTSGEVFLGLLVGLFIAEYDAEYAT